MLDWNPLPKIGPQLFAIEGFRGAIIAGGSSLGPPGSDAAVLNPLCAFQFPRDLFITGLLVVPRTAPIATSLAGLTLRIQDESFEDMVLTGTSQGTGDNTASCAALFRVPPQLVGQVNVRPFAIQRPVRSHDQWLFTIGNVTGGAITVASLTLFFAEPRQALYGAGVNV